MPPYGLNFQASLTAHNPALQYLRHRFCFPDKPVHADSTGISLSTQPKHSKFVNHTEWLTMNNGSGCVFAFTSALIIQRIQCMMTSDHACPSASAKFMNSQPSGLSDNTLAQISLTFYKLTKTELFTFLFTLFLRLYFTCTG